jgi:hypothetical protein
MYCDYCGQSKLDTDVITCKTHFVNMCTSCVMAIADNADARAILAVHDMKRLCKAASTTGDYDHHGPLRFAAYSAQDCNWD